jgi:hypothetical protein
LRVCAGGARRHEEGTILTRPHFDEGVFREFPAGINGGEEDLSLAATVTTKKYDKQRKLLIADSSACAKDDNKKQQQR